MNRGSALTDSDRAIARYASMRPRFMNRGSQRCLWLSPAPAPRFNEAPIHESGKYRHPLPVTRHPPALQ